MTDTRYCEALDAVQDSILKSRKVLYVHLGDIRSAINLLKEIGDEDAETLANRLDHDTRELAVLRADVFTKIIGWKEAKRDEEPEQNINDTTFWQPVINTLAAIGTAGWLVNKNPYVGMQFDRNISVAVKTTPGFAATTIVPPPAHMNDGKRHEIYRLGEHVAEAQFLSEEATAKSAQMATALEEDPALTETLDEL